MLLRAHFDPDDTLIIVDGHVVGPYGRSDELRFAVDTAATLTTLQHRVANDVGLHLLKRVPTVIRSAIGEESGYAVFAPFVTSLDATISEVMVQIADLPDLGIDGLLGLSFLSKLNYEIRSKEGLIRAEYA